MKKHLSNLGIALLCLLVIGGCVALIVGTRGNGGDGYRDRYYELRENLPLCHGTGHFVLDDTQNTFFVLDNFQIVDASPNIDIGHWFSYFNFNEHILYLNIAGTNDAMWVLFRADIGFTHAMVCCCVGGGYTWNVKRVGGGL